MLGSRSVVRQFVPSRCEKRLSAHLPANSRFLNRAQPRDRPLIEKPNGEFPCFPPVACSRRPTFSSFGRGRTSSHAPSV